MIMKKYDVFISYSRVDYLDENNNVIKGSPLDKIITKFEENKVNYWIDIDGNNTSNQYMAKITKAIDDSKKVLFVSSKNSNGQDSYWPILEISYASEHHKEIIPVRVDNSGFNVNIKLAFAGLDIVEYYKNPEQSIVKLVERIAQKQDGGCSGEKMKLWDKVSNVLGLLLVGFVSLFLFFSVFFTIGFCVGFFSNIEDEEKILNDAFRKKQIEAINGHTINYYKGDNLYFTYDLDKELIDFTGNDSKLFDQISFESLMMSMSIPLAFDRLFKTTQMYNGKTKVYALVFGSMGILFGYTIGVDIGESCALVKNEDSLKEYLKEDSTKQMIRKRIMLINQ